MRSYDDLLVQPWVGSSWEGFVIEQIVATLAVSDRRFDPYFLRTSDGHEIDLLIDLGRERWAFEIKLTSEPEPRDLDRLEKIADLVRATKRILVSQTRESAFSERKASCSLGDLLARLRAHGTP